MTSPRSILVGFGLTALLTFAGVARAEESDTAAADRLFREGQALVDKNVAAACEKFSASYAKEQKPGTLLNLAFCHEKQERYWDAWREYREVAEIARAAGKRERLDFAVAHAADVAKNLPRVQLRVEASLVVTGVSVDDHPLHPSDYTSVFPVTPGERHIVVSVRDKAPFDLHVAISDDTNEVHAVRVPPPPKNSEFEAPANVAKAGNAESPTGDSKDASSHVQKPLGLMLGGVGAASIVVGAIFGIETLIHQQRSVSDCSGVMTVCANVANAVRANADVQGGRTDAAISDVTFIAGAALLATGILLYVTAPSDAAAPAEPASNVSFVPSVGPHAAGASFALRF